MTADPVTDSIENRAASSHIEALTRIEANELIRELLSAYCGAVDAGDFEAMAALFVDETGYIDGGVVGHNRGRAAIAAAFRKLTGPMPTTSWAHLTGNVVIRHHAPGVASVRSQFLGAAQERGSKNVVVAAAGRYEDEVVVVDGEWKFASRRIHLDLLGA